MSTVLILGAGAIGRGYLPWVIDPAHALVFVERNPEILARMRSQGGYRTYMVKKGELLSRFVPVSEAFSPDEASKVDLSQVVLTFCAVGPRNVAQVGELLKGVGGPVVLCENDPATVDLVKAITGRDDVYFAVPDVITSNTAPAELLANDPLAVVSEDGVMFVEEGAGTPLGDWQVVSRAALDVQWTAKLYLHNTPHCVAAYLGARIGATYLHESMMHPKAEAIVRGSMNEMLTALKLRWEIPHDFLDWYADKELARFANQRLCDPIARVAREPLRKLNPDGRLIGAARICLSHGILPHHILLGITSALLFDDPRDADKQLSFLRRALPTEQLLTLVLGLTPGEALALVLRQQLPNLEAKIQRLSEVQ